MSHPDDAVQILRELFYLRMPGGDKLGDTLLELGHQQLWLRIFAVVEPDHAVPPSTTWAEP